MDQMGNIQTYGVTMPRLIRRRKTEQKWHAAYEKLYPELFKTIKDCDGWYPLNFTEYRKKHGINRIPYEILHELRIHPNIISRESDVVKGAVRGMSEYRWVAPEEKVKLKFKSLFFANLREPQLKRLEEAFPDTMPQNMVANIMVVYDHCVKLIMEKNWVRFEPNVIAMDYGILIDDVFKAMEALEQAKLAVLTETVMHFKGTFYLCHLTTQEKDWAALQAEIVNGEAYRDPIATPKELSRRHRVPKRNFAKITSEKEEMILNAADNSNEFGNRTFVLSEDDEKNIPVHQHNEKLGLDSFSNNVIINDEEELRNHLFAIKNLLRKQSDKAVAYHGRIAKLQAQLEEAKEELTIAREAVKAKEMEIAALQEQIGESSLPSKDLEKAQKYDEIWQKLTLAVNDNTELRSQTEKAVKNLKDWKQVTLDALSEMRTHMRRRFRNYEADNTSTAKERLIEDLEDYVSECSSKIKDKIAN